MPENNDKEIISYNHFCLDRTQIDWLECLRSGEAKDRVGRKVRIYAIDGGGTTPIHGAHCLDERGWLSCSWGLTGHYLTDGTVSTLDIVGPCPEVKEVILSDLMIPYVPGSDNVCAHGVNLSNDCPQCDSSVQEVNS